MLDESSASLSPARGRRLGTAQVVFLASMVALDFAFGWVAKPLMHAVDLGGIVKFEMIPPVMLMLLARLTLDRFGALIAYEGAWGIVAMVAMPGAVLPGPLKLVPLLLQGLFLDAAFSAFRRWGMARVFLAAVLGGVAGNACLMLFRVLLGMPWARATQVFFGLQMLGGIGIHLAGAALAVLVWKRVRSQEAVRWIQVAP